MEGMEEILKTAAPADADPEWDERQREMREKREAETRKALGGAQRDLLGKLDLPAKDMELIRSPAFTRTDAVEALERAAVLTILEGGTGTGKTTAASWWLYAWVMDPGSWGDVNTFGNAPKPLGSVMFVTAARLARWPRYNDGQMESLLRPVRLVIDDLGAEFYDAKGSFGALVDEVVNERYANRRPTVITTNMVMKDFVARYGDRITDRIREAGKWIGLGQESMRGKGRAPRQVALAAVPTPAARPIPPDPRLPREEDPDDVGTGA